MASTNDAGRENVERLAQALEEFEDCFIEAVRDSVLTSSPPLPQPAISEADLLDLEAVRRPYHDSNYELNDMIQFFRSLPSRKRMWKLVTLSLLRAYTRTGTPSEWRYRLREIQHAGDILWRSGISSSHEFALLQDRLLIINGLIDHFRVFDDFIDQIWVEIGETGKRTRFSNEFEDTLKAIITLRQTGGTYMPLDPGTINVAKDTVRRQREADESASIAEPTVDTANLSSQPQPPPVPAVKASSPHKYDPTMNALVGIFVLLSAVLGYQAWEYSPHEPGTTKDADFWFLLQGSSMQLLGILSIVIPLKSSTTLIIQSRNWTWFFVTTSLVCTIGSIPAYLYAPTEWSSLLSFVGSAVQALVILQMMYSIE